MRTAAPRPSIGVDPFPPPQERPHALAVGSPQRPSRHRDRGRWPGRPRGRDRPGPPRRSRDGARARRASRSGAAVQPRSLVHDRHHRAWPPRAAPHRRHFDVRRRHAPVQRDPVPRPHRPGLVGPGVDRLPRRHPARADGRRHRPPRGRRGARVRIARRRRRRPRRHRHDHGAPRTGGDPPLRPDRRRGRRGLSGPASAAGPGRRLHRRARVDPQLRHDDRAGSRRR